MLQRVDGLAVDSYYSTRKETIEKLYKKLLYQKVIFIRAPSFAGKTSLAKLCEIQFNANEDINCILINGMTYITQTNEKLSISQFKKEGKQTILIIDEVRCSFNFKDYYIYHYYIDSILI